MNQQRQSPTGQAIYQDVERLCMPIIQAAARRFYRKLGASYDDVIQDCRIALWEGVQSYDYNASHGGIYRFAQTIVRNALCAQLYAATTRRRIPHIVVEEDGEKRLMRSWPALVEDWDDVRSLAPFPDTPEEEAASSEVKDKLLRLKMRLMNRLNAKQSAVFECLAHPSDEFALFLRNKGAKGVVNDMIAEFLGVSKNSVDWSIHRIKEHFTALVEDEFSDLIADAIRLGKWPMFYVSGRFDDVEFIQSTISSNALDDARPTKPREVLSNSELGALRSIETYVWGSVIMVRLGEREATVIARGEFNPLSGEVLTEQGTWKSIMKFVPWYGELNRALKKNGGN